MADNYYGARYRQNIANAVQEMIYGPSCWEVFPMDRTRPLHLRTTITIR
jgi:hypothetical protein